MLYQLSHFRVTNYVQYRNSGRVTPRGQARAECLPRVRVTLKNTTALGDRSELEVALALTRNGRTELRPLSAGLRYDLAVDNGDGTIMRIQCKTGLLKSGAVYFRAYNADARRPNGVAYRGQIEAFGVFCPQTGSVYLVPIKALVSISTARLRVNGARNGQVKGVLNARDFTLAPGRQPGGSSL